MAKTIGFYQNFNLDLQRLSSALRCIQDDPKMGHLSLARCMSVNEPVAEGFSSWLRHVGLTKNVSSQGSQKAATHQLTSFGALAYQYDPNLTDIGTQWILHYYLVTRRFECSYAWYILINKYLPNRFEFSGDQFQSFFIDAVGSEASNRSAVKKDPLVALSTYSRLDALGRLQILEKLGNIYVVRRPELPSSLIVGYILLDWWQHRYNETNTLRFSQFCSEDESLGRVCLAEANQVRQYIVELSGLGYLSFSETQHEPVNRLFQDQPSALLERYYKHR